MRRKDRELTEEEARAVLRRAEYGVLSLVTEDGAPYAVPMSYAAVGDAIYFHGRAARRWTVWHIIAARSLPL